MNINDLKNKFATDKGKQMTQLLTEWISHAKDEELGALYNLISDEMDKRSLFDPETLTEETLLKQIPNTEAPTLEKIRDAINQELQKRGQNEPN